MIEDRSGADVDEMTAQAIDWVAKLQVTLWK